MPFILLILFVADFIAIASPLIAFYLYREWEQHSNITGDDDYAQRCLYGAIALAIFSLLGRYLIRPLLSKRRKDEDEPHVFEPGKRDSIKRPDGNVINIEYYGKEDGQPIILVHGLSANIKNWYHQRKFFEKDYRLIMMDLPGMGKSTSPLNKDFSMEKIAADIQAVIEHTGARNPILWGHSMGGMAILTLVAKMRDLHRSSIKAIILQHTTYTNPVRTIIFSHFFTAIQISIITPLCYFLIFFSPVIWIFRWMGYLNGSSLIVNRFVTFAGTQTSKQLDFVTYLSTCTSPAVLARGSLGMFHYDVTNQLSQITEPTLIIAANKDILTKPDASVFMNEHIPNSKLIMVSPANHQGLVERHEEVNEAALHFIQSLAYTNGHDLNKTNKIE